MACSHCTLSAISLVVLLTKASGFFLPTPASDHVAGYLPTPTPNVVSRGEERRLMQKRVDEDEDDDDLFKGVDPRTLAAVLLEALNHSHVDKGMEKDEGPEGRHEKLEADRQVRTMEEGVDRDRDGRHEIELLMAAQGKEQQKKEEEERKKAQEEEERMTERVTSRTTSQKVQVQTPQPRRPTVSGADGQDSQLTTGSEQDGDVEEQLNPEELKSLETMMKEFPRLNTATKREGDPGHNQREGRGYSSYNEILPVNKGSEKKMKWQEETQKALSFPSFRGGNFMDDFGEGDNAGGDPAETLQALQEKDKPKVEDEEEEEENEEALSPEEEEAQAKAEQEEMRRQAAEAQKAKMEEEKLADIASDMLLRYMVKQNGNRKFNSPLSNAAEDKRSEEQQQDVEEEDIDPQTIDKLIEISSKLHLPADDVVDIISDVEKKKKKDVPSETPSYWKRPQMPVSDLPLSNSFLVPQTKQTSYRPRPPSVNLLKSWFQDKSPAKSEERWSFSPGASNIWPKQKSIDQEPWLTSSAWNSYPRYPYPYFYQRKYSPVYYPLYYPSSPRPNLSYYFPKGDRNPFPPRRRFHSWVQPRLRQPPSSIQRNPYYTGVPFSLYPRRMQPVPKPLLPPMLPAITTQKKPFYYSAPAAARSKDYYDAGTKPDSSNRENLEKYIQQILMTRPLH